MVQKHLEFKDEQRTIKNIFNRYKLYKFRLQYAYKLVFSNKKIDKHDLEEWKAFIQMIDRVLEYMNREHANIINNMHIKDKDYRDLGYCTTTFYSKYHDAINEFLGYINVNRK